MEIRIKLPIYWIKRIIARFRIIKGYKQLIVKIDQHYITKLHRANNIEIFYIVKKLEKRKLFPATKYGVYKCELIILLKNNLGEHLEYISPKNNYVYITKKQLYKDYTLTSTKWNGLN